MSAPAVRAVVADDHPVFRQGLRVLLEDLGVEVVAEAADGEEAVAAVRRERPDVVLMDLQMPVLSGIEATRQLVAADPDVRVLVLTMVADDEAVFAAVQAGALGYVLKGAGQAEIGRALAAVAEGQAVYGAAVAQRLRAFFTAGSGVVARPFPELSDREREVLDLVAGGLPNAAIARRLFLSEKTVRNHITSVFAKLGVRDRAEAVVRAREAGLGGATGR
ncbi:response regulator [Blastococcus sp. SYSU D00813]